LLKCNYLKKTEKVLKASANLNKNTTKTNDKAKPQGKNLRKKPGKNG
jgi:hypothetical protein